MTPGRISGPTPLNYLRRSYLDSASCNGPGLAKSTLVIRFLILSLVLACGCDSSSPDLALGSTSDPVQVFVDCDKLPSDAIEINEAELSGDRLVLNVSYGGGCAEHRFAVCWDGAFVEESPVRAVLALRHDSGGDSCEAYLTRDIEVDLSLLRQSFEEGYPGQPRVIELSVEDGPELPPYQW